MVGVLSDLCYRVAVLIFVVDGCVVDIFADGGLLWYGCKKWGLVHGCMIEEERRTVWVLWILYWFDSVMLRVAVWDF